ncbi:histidinol-phosphate transaminase [Tropicimonas isoalkanivorans]|uniref:Histidinol-phosphate aminotransferase n=1 Tax=Tropicimonas isoalkanivorans TaxID=441112 RepID=A0A1I1HGT4_9RHOB|nr:histidinol-phosphate transaminase [Tropicimonas isoalkanivorans]SFC22792.1 histidinol-phosphate aminotransferase [Tropicimonas isoalkanivorans]
MASPEFALRPELAALLPYNSGLTLADVASRCGGKTIAKLASNENPYPLPEEALRAMQAAIRSTQVYPDPSARDLAVALSRLTGVPAARVIFGDGSEDLLNVLARAVLRPGDEIVTLYPSFPLHEDYARMMGARVVTIDLTADRRIDIDALLAAVARPVRLTILANPMSPAGLWLTPQELDRVLDAQHPESVLCLDEAYVEYALGEDYLAGTERLAGHDKPLLVLRTFSKAYGLAGLRIGYGLSNCDDLIRGMNLVRTPFNVNAVAQAAALAVLRHPEAMRDAVARTLAERSRVSDALRAQGLEVLPSKGNFLFVNVGAPAVEIADRLIDHGVIVKPWKQPGYESFIRVSIGLPAENDQFLSALETVLGD